MDGSFYFFFLLLLLLTLALLLLGFSPNHQYCEYLINTRVCMYEADWGISLQFNWDFNLMSNWLKSKGGHELYLLKILWTSKGEKKILIRTRKMKMLFIKNNLSRFRCVMINCHDLNDIIFMQFTWILTQFVNMYVITNVIFVCFVRFVNMMHARAAAAKKLIIKAVKWNYFHVYD